MSPIQKLADILTECFHNEKLVAATLSSPKAKVQPVLKIAVRPLLIKGRLSYQVSRYTKEKAFHENLSKEECRDLLQQLISGDYKQSILQTEKCDYHILSGKKNLKIFEKPATKKLKISSHNLPKEYLLKEGVPIPFLIKLGIQNTSGKVMPGKRDKFKQINRFLEIVAAVLPAYQGKGKLRVLDFGCGKAYLTFALYYYLRAVLSLDPEITGIDLKEDVLQNCRQLAKELGYSNLHFVFGDINTYHPESEIDLMVALHACDTATDAALEKAVEWKAKVILSVPCCQHELLSQVKNDDLKPLLEHGILKEKFSSLVTDAARGKLLEAVGYKVDIVEFIDPEHTPKNILIRAVRKSKNPTAKKFLEEYEKFKKLLNINPSLERRFIY